MTASIVDALAAVRAGDLDRAAQLTAGDTSRLGRALADYLRRPHDGSVYVEPSAFTAFIRGGGNVGLYAATSRFLADRYDTTTPASLLDIGCGDGRALLPALAAAARLPERLGLVEPSVALLEDLTRSLAGSPVLVDTWPTGAARFADTLTDDEHWDLVESTFALHTLPPTERDSVLTQLRPHVDRLVIVEFDVPDSAPGSAEHLGRLAETYEHGLAEYPDDDLVAQGFLLPVLVGQLAPGAVRMSWEQPASAWRAQLERAGFTDVRTQPLFDYWSAPAFALTAG